MREGRDRGGAQSQQNPASVIGITLEVAMQPAGCRRDSKRVAGPCEMIDADLHIAMTRKLACDEIGLIDKLAA